jgi:hypothetical protein
LTMTGRAEEWFTANAAYFSLPGFILAGIGLFGLAIKNRVRLPLLLAGVHLICAILLPDFVQFDRTSIYLIPQLCLGAGWTVAVPISALHKRPLANAVWITSGASAVVALTALHLVREIPRLIDPLRIEPWGYYLAQQGDWRPTQREIEAILPPGAVLVPWDYPISHIYSSLRPGDGSGPSLFIPLSTLLDRQKNGSLATYVARRRIVLPAEAPVFVLGPPDDVTALAARLSAAFGDAGFEDSGALVQVTAVREWRDKSWPLIYPTLTLYRIVRAPG